MVGRSARRERSSVSMPSRHEDPVVAGDDRLARQAITAFNNSRVPDGITLSRYPTSMLNLSMISPCSKTTKSMVTQY